MSIDDRLSSIIRHKLRDPYTSSDELEYTTGRKIKNHTLVTRTIKTANNMINYITSLSYFRVSTRFRL